MRRREALLNACGFAALFALGALGLGGAATSPGGIRLGVPPLAGCLGLLLGLALLWRRGAQASACAPLLAIPLALLAGLPLPGQAALSGPPLLAVFAAGLLAVLPDALARLASRAFLPVIFILYAGAAARVQSQVGPQGDEPHYLMVADSLLRDQDLDLTQDYAEGHYRAFHPQPLEPHYRVRGTGGEIYSLHAIGLSLLILPAYALFGYTGASFFMAFLAALLAREIRELVRAFTGRERLATGLGWAVALSPPLVHYVGLIFSEVPAALLVGLGLRYARDACAAGPARALAWGTALAALPWLNVRYALFPAILLGLALCWRRNWRGLKAAVAPLLVSALAIAVYHHALYGFFDPRRVYGRRPEFALATLADGLPGLLLDQEFGLLVYAPFFALAALGLARLWRSARRDAVAVGLLVLVVLGTAGTWDMWRGGFNPPARFLVPVIPALAVGVAAGISRGQSAPAALLFGWSLWTGLAGAAEPALVHRDRDGTAPFFRVHSGAEEWTRLLPSYVLADPDRHRLALVWALALAAAVLARGQRPSGRGLSVAVAGLMGAAAVASHLSQSVTSGRDAARLSGRAGLEVPGYSVTTTARWGPGVLGWGPLYEPHRFPDGAPVGERLRLAEGTYRIEIAADPGVPVSEPAPELEVRPEANGVAARRYPMARSAAGWSADFPVRPGEQGGLRLALIGGSPLLLRSVALDGAVRSTSSTP